MATLVLQSSGSVIGGLIGGPLGAMAGRTFGKALGSSIDRTLWKKLKDQSAEPIVEGPQALGLDNLISLEGAPIPRAYGRMRLGGQLIWATRFEEERQTVTTPGPRQGSKFASRAPTLTAITYAYYGNFAIGICEGPIAYVRRIWAEGRELDRSQFTIRVYNGTHWQMPDPLILAKEGQDNAPAYRGLAYIVFERFPLGDFGNRIPQISFEVIRPVARLAVDIQAITLIPGAGEFVYATSPVYQVQGPGRTFVENRHQRIAETNVHAALDVLQSICPNLKTISLVVTWFGDDLRAEKCTISPRVEDTGKITEPQEWSVSGINRAQGQAVSRVNGRPSYGGTPSDQTVIELIQEIKRRGWRIVLYPFVMMDIPQNNTLPHPLGEGNQPAYPWRGRITSGAYNVYQSVAAFFGRAEGQHFSPYKGSLIYQGPHEWSFRRLVLHYAHLAQQAGGVHGFVLGSEYVGLTHLRAWNGIYFAVSHFVRLAHDIRIILSQNTDIVYAADWTEYGAHVYNDGKDIDFPLDPLWSSPDITAIGIDFYAPLSDWRDDDQHADQDIAASIYDRSYLKKRVHSGEGFDWYYATDHDRIAQKRQSIRDEAYGKDWIYRVKDIAGWWSNLHYSRRNGYEIGVTAYQPKSKPIWLTEIGIPAVDKGSNGPHIFPDFKSSDAGFPVFSSKMRDDLIQIRGLEALYDAFSSVHERHNPYSPVYGAPMIESKNLFVWTWDARPFPTFPDFSSLWGDADHWQTGHWITGRLEGAPLDGLIAHVLKDYGVKVPVSIDVDGFVDGYIIDRTMSIEAALQSLFSLFDVHISVHQGVLRFLNGFRPKPEITLHKEDLIHLNNQGTLIEYGHVQATALPSEIRLYFLDSDRAYRRTSLSSRRLLKKEPSSLSLDVSASFSPREAQKRVDMGLQALWLAREHITFSVSDSCRHLCVGDLIYVPLSEGNIRLFRLENIRDSGQVRLCQAFAAMSYKDISSVDNQRTDEHRTVVSEPLRMPGKAQAVVLDLSLGKSYPLQSLAVFSDPWPGCLAVWRSSDRVNYLLHALVPAPSIIGQTQTDFPPGFLWRWNRGASLDVYFPYGHLHSISEMATLAGGNTFAICDHKGEWEVFSVSSIELIAPYTYRFNNFLRGLGGSEILVQRTVLSGAVIVRLDETLVPLASTLNDIGQAWHYRIVAAHDDYSVPSAALLESTVSPLGLKPYAPVHLRAVRMIDGIHISGIRQSRYGGDQWDFIDPPLGEDFEQYKLHIWKDPETFFSLESSKPKFLFSNEDELKYFRNRQRSLFASMCQVSTVVGDGFWNSQEICVHCDNNYAQY
jgi:hypothetical protein